MRFSKATLVKVAAFTSVCLAATVLLALRLDNYKLFAGYTTYKAVFSDGTGVHPGDSVKVAGVSVGRVKGATIRNGKAVVTFELSEDVPMTTTTRAVLRWRNILGLRYLYLYPHSGGRPLKDGGTIPLANTTDAADVGEFLNDLGPVLQAIDPKAANAFVEAVDTALTGDETTVRGLIDNGSRLATQLADVDSQISSLIGSSDKILNAYARQHRAIAGILDNLNSVGGVLQDTTSDINGVLTDFSDVQAKLDYLLSSERGNIDATLGQLGTIAATLAENKHNLEKTLCTTPMGIAGYFQTSSWGEWFNVRVTTATVHDADSRTILRQPELSQERKAKAPKAFVGCPRGKGSFYGPRGKGLERKPGLPGRGGLQQIVEMLTGGRDA